MDAATVSYLKALDDYNKGLNLGLIPLTPKEHIDPFKGIFVTLGDGIKGTFEEFHDLCKQRVYSFLSMEGETLPVIPATNCLRWDASTEFFDFEGKWDSDIVPLIQNHLPFDRTRLLLQLSAAAYGYELPICTSGQVDYRDYDYWNWELHKCCRLVACSLLYWARALRPTADIFIVNTNRHCLVADITKDGYIQTVFDISWYCKMEFRKDGHLLRVLNEAMINDPVLYRSYLGLLSWQKLISESGLRSEFG
jgi:hypothetical protein